MKHIGICIILALFICSLHTVQAECTRDDFVVAIDTGHSRGKVGANSARGIGEYNFNKNITEMLYGYLVRDGFTKTLLVNEKGDDVSLDARAGAANEKQADLFVSVHHDSVQPIYLAPWEYQGARNLYSDKYKGFSIFVSSLNPMARQSHIFAELLGTELLKAGLTPTLHHAEKIKGENRELLDKERGIYRFDNLVVLRKVKAPAVLLECGVIVNREEERLLADPGYQQRVVLSILHAVEAFCNK